MPILRWLLALAALLGALRLAHAEPPALLALALASEAAGETERALELFLAVERATPNDAFVLQKIARQFSDLVVDQPTAEAKKNYARTALGYAQRAVTLQPDNAVNVLSLAICHGKLAVHSGTGDKVRYSRLIKDDAERALALDPNYAWAHHVLGRWHYEIAELGTTARVFVRLFYGGLPDASTARGIELLERAVALEPDELNHHLELGFAYAAAGRAADARASWERGLAIPSRARHDDSSKLRAREALQRLRS